MASQALTVVTLIHELLEGHTPALGLIFRQSSLYLGKGFQVVPVQQAGLLQTGKLADGVIDDVLVR
jgi:hypothetical protein|tara:strand:+ start:280 stop:477 length:198 start_codon:yes stop_codon:yes gene_type:complete